MPDPVLHIPPVHRRGAKRNQEESLASAVDLIQLMCDKFERESLAGMKLLDMGCGSKLVQAILNQGLPLGQYRLVFADSYFGNGSM